MHKARQLRNIFNSDLGSSETNFEDWVYHRLGAGASADGIETNSFPHGQRSLGHSFKEGRHEATHCSNACSIEEALGRHVGWVLLYLRWGPREAP